ncbi:hypothetical protein NE237_025413 [Protea cynaroides]|uniref:Uncharacterized protein n=1 Tax=Protea cynaroides TaxID=273540 RepID=A0A9Q0H670_9MAGN|nr:hypothetical protein NE237_025413 [Protea cynaroides]
MVVRGGDVRQGFLDLNAETVESLWPVSEGSNADGLVKSSLPILSGSSPLLLQRSIMGPDGGVMIWNRDTSSGLLRQDLVAMEGVRIPSMNSMSHVGGLGFRPNVSDDREKGHRKEIGRWANVVDVEEVIEREEGEITVNSGKNVVTDVAPTLSIPDDDAQMNVMEGPLLREIRVSPSLERSRQVDSRVDELPEEVLTDEGMSEQRQTLM